MALDCTLGFLGFGNMATAIAQGLIDSETLAADKMAAYDLSADRRNAADEIGIRVEKSCSDLFDTCDAVVLAVKPQNIAHALESLDEGHGDNKLVISIAAGVTIQYIQHLLGESTRVVRVMPNTPALVGCGAAGLAFSSKCTGDDKNIVETIFNAVGISEQVTERQIDVVTALSGSGPAYFFYMVECMTRAAVAQGLPQKAAERLAAQTMLGAGTLLSESDESPAVLRERVTSKGGTTEAALQSLEDDAFGDIVAQAMAEAIARAQHLAK